MARAAFALALIPALSLIALAQDARSVPDDVRVGFESINAEQSRKWLEFLAGPETLGRGTGQPGYQRAAEYIADHLRTFGLKPIGEDGTYFQNVPFIRTRVNPASAISSGPFRLTVGKDLGFQPLTQELDIEKRVVFVRARGPETTVPEGANFEDKIVVLITRDVNPRFRTQIQQRRPALMFNLFESVPEPTWSAHQAGRQQRARLAQGRISEAAAARLAVALGLPASAADPGQGAAYEELEARQPLKVHASVEEEEIGVPNVVGLYEGSDPDLKHEVVALGAHLDHLGTDGTTVWWGADDDASGCTALLNIARAFSENPVKPKRSILFIWFAAEEMGLIGSRYYTENPIIPLKDTICMLNMDMVGRNEESATEKPEENVDTIHLVGSKRISTQLHDLVIAQNDHVNLRFKYNHENAIYTRSDHYSFARHGIPIAFLFSGFHPDYHQPTDTPDKINYDKIVSASRLFYLVAHRAANRNAPFPKDVQEGGLAGKISLR
jgi:hypothetical protein